MEEDDSKSQSPQEDRQVRLEQFVAENAEGFQERVEDILEEIAQDGNFSEMKAELYDQKKSYLTRHLTELSRMHKVLTDQISTTLRYSTPIGTDSVLSGGFSGFCVSKTEDSKSFSLSSGSGSDSLVSTNKLLISPVNDDARKDKETKAPEVLLEKNFNLDEELVSLVDENTKSKREIQDKELDTGTQTADLGNEKERVIELEKEVADLKHALSVSNLKNTTSDDVIKGLKQQRSIQDDKESQVEQELQSLKSLLDYVTKQAHSYEERILGYEDQISLYEDEISKHVDEISERDNEITELKKTNKQCTSEITQLKSTYKAKENNWRTSVGKLRNELEVKSESVDDLNEKLDTVRAEKFSQDNLIQELEKMNKQYTSEITQLKSTYKATENNWRDSIGKLRKELEKKGESVDDLTKKLDTLQAEKCSQENLFQEQETRLNSLQAYHEGVLASSENAQKVTNELTERVLELEREVDMQREVILVRDEEKREAIRQLSSSLEHYQSRYKELPKAFVSKNTASCFDFLH